VLLSIAFLQRFRDLRLDQLQSQQFPTDRESAQFSTESPSNDSRLEIIGFGRQLAEQPESEQAVQHELIVGDDEVPDGENADSSGPAADSDDTAKNPDDDDDIDNRLQDFLKEF